MILIGQYDSPFVRRVAVALHLYGIPYEHRPWSTFGDADKIAEFNPLRRVPTIVLDDGEVLIDSTAILDFFDGSVSESESLIARSGRDRRLSLKVCAMATGLCDKIVGLVYERVLHAETSDAWIARCQTQIRDVLDHLEADRAVRPTPFWFGPRIGHADIATTCAMRFLAEAQPDMFDAARWPALVASAERCESLEAFKANRQRFEPPKR